MKSAQSPNYYITAIGESLLLIWWGVVIVVDPLTLAIGAIVAGLILLGVNAARRLMGIPRKRTTSALGVIALVWGALAQALSLTIESSFAVMLIVTGAVGILFCLAYPRNPDPSPA